MSIAVEVFDSRRNQLGEGPTASGSGNNQVQWCDIYGQFIRSKNLVTGEILNTKQMKQLAFKSHE